MNLLKVDTFPLFLNFLEYLTVILTRTSFILDHLKEEEVCQLLDVITVVDAIMPQGVAETPEFANDVSHLSPLSVLTAPVEGF